MASQSSPSCAEPAQAALPAHDVLLIAGPDDPVLADFVAFVGDSDRPVVVLSTAAGCRRVGSRADVYPVERAAEARSRACDEGQRLSGLVLFLGRRSMRDLLDAVAQIAGEARPEVVCIVSTFRVHFGDERAAQAEAEAVERLKPLARRVAVFRPSHVLSGRSRTRSWLRLLAPCYPLVPARFRSCCVAGGELFAALGRELERAQARNGAVYTLLGPNRPWQDVLRQHHGGGCARTTISAGLTLLSWLMLGQLVGLCFAAITRRRRWWNFDTLRPQSTQELLALYNSYNHGHVKVVGYNNGVVHFGHHYPDRTVVSTVRCNHVACVRGATARFDAGVTVRQATDVLAAAGKELYVAPNYSYVSLGTAFFIPIHGSAADYCTLADTIDRVLLYDPVHDRFLSARRDAPAFREHAYNLRSPVLLLQLELRVKDRATYYRTRQSLEAPASERLLAVLRDDQASNVEIRKAKAAAQVVEVSRYYTQPPPGVTDALAVPRDALGRLWDRLEENPVTSVLFHALVRRFAYHVELFFTPTEFDVFWRTHGRLPLAKIQLRYLKRDALPHSPLRRSDRVSADLFMLRRHRQAFDAYVKETFREVEFNPGKHSR